MYLMMYRHFYLPLLAHIKVLFCFMFNRIYQLKKMLNQDVRLNGEESRLAVRSHRHQMAEDAGEGTALLVA